MFSDKSPAVCHCHLHQDHQQEPAGGGGQRSEYTKSKASQTTKNPDKMGEVGCGRRGRWGGGEVECGRRWSREVEFGVWSVKGGRWGVEGGGGGV